MKHKRFTDECIAAILDRLHSMDDFKTPKKSTRTSVDGFVPARGHHAHRTSDLQAFNHYYKPNAQRSSAPGKVRQVDGFSRIDGYQQGIQPAITSPGFSQRQAEVTAAFDVDKDKASHQQAAHQTDASAHDKKRRRFSLRRKRREKVKKKLTKKKLALRVSTAFAVFILLVGGGILLRGFLAGRNIFKGGGNSALLNSENVDPAQLRGEGDGRVNVLLLGKGGAEQHDGPDLTDTIIVASIDPIANEAALLSIPRDFWVKSPSGYQSKINEVYANAKNAALNTYSYKQRTSDEAKDKAEQAGIDAMKKTVSDTMGVPIHYYAMIDFAGFKKAVDTVGGVDIDVTDNMAVKETMWINGKNYYLNVGAGRQHFDGLKALAFSRSRKTSARGDFSRAERQRAVILALKDKVLSTGTLANPLKINQLISDFGDQISTDFSINEILRLYDLSKNLPGDKVVSVGLDEYVTGDMIRGLSVQVPKAGTFSYSEIQNYVRNIMRDAFLKQEDAKIAVLNGTTKTGLATKKANELKSYGYNILTVGDAPTDTYTTTVLVDLRSGNKKYTLNYLEKRLNIKATQALPDATIDATEADFVIILGADQNN